LSNIHQQLPLALDQRRAAENLSRECRRQCELQRRFGAAVFVRLAHAMDLTSAPCGAANALEKLWWMGNERPRSPATNHFDEIAPSHSRPAV